jgi:5-formyltetrahydrofolate cyclo-ligase
MGDLMTKLDKTHLRTQLKEWCAAHSAQHDQLYDAHIAQQILGIVQGHLESGVIGCYLSMEHEMSSRKIIEILQGAGYQIAIPVVVTKDRPLDFRLYHTQDKLVLDAERLWVPSPDAVSVTPDALVIPVLGFNAHCYRLGRGGGYYDRTLAVLRPILTIGIGYDGQSVDFAHDPHDLPLDYIVTETRILQARI